MLLAVGGTGGILAGSFYPAMADGRGLVVGIGIGATRTGMSCPAARGAARRGYGSNVIVAEGLDAFRFGLTANGALVTLNTGSGTSRIIMSGLAPRVRDHRRLTSLHDLIGIAARAFHAGMAGGRTRRVNNLLYTEIVAEGL